MLTVGETIDRTDALVPNPIAREQKMAWLYTMAMLEKSLSVKMVSMERSLKSVTETYMSKFSQDPKLEILL